MAVAVLPVPAFAALVAPVFPLAAAAPVPFCAVAVCFLEAAGALPEEDALAVSLACEVFVVADFFAGVFAAGFASAVVLSAGLVGAEAAEESCAALEAGACCACAGAKKMVPASSMAATPEIKVDGLKKVGFCIPLLWHPASTRANESLVFGKHFASLK